MRSFSLFTLLALFTATACEAEAPPPEASEPPAEPSEPPAVDESDLVQPILQECNELAQIVTSFVCGCDLDPEIYPDRESCLAEQESNWACTCTAYARLPENAEHVACLRDFATAYSECLAKLECGVDTEPCLVTALAELEATWGACPGYGPQTTDELASCDAPQEL